MKYKNYILLILAFLVIGLLGCKKLDNLTQFEMEYNEKVVVPASSSIQLPINVGSPEVESNSESTFALNDTRKDLVEEIQLEELNLKITSPQDADFSFLQSIKIYLNADGLPEQKIAWKENIKDNAGKELELSTTNDDLKEYIKKKEFLLRVNTVTDEALGEDHHININSVFFVDAKVAE